MADKDTSRGSFGVTLGVGERIVVLTEDGEVDIELRGIEGSGGSSPRVRVSCAGPKSIRIERRPADAPKG